MGPILTFMLLGNRLGFGFVTVGDPNPLVAKRSGAVSADRKTSA